MRIFLVSSKNVKTRHLCEVQESVLGQAATQSGERQGLKTQKDIRRNPPCVDGGSHIWRPSRPGTASHTDCDGVRTDTQYHNCVNVSASSGKRCDYVRLTSTEFVSQKRDMIYLDMSELRSGLVYDGKPVAFGGSRFGRE